MNKNVLEKANRIKSGFSGMADLGQTRGARVLDRVTLDVIDGGLKERNGITERAETCIALPTKE